MIRSTDIKDIDELLAIAAQYGDDNKQAIEQSIRDFIPCIIFNQVTQTPSAHFARLQNLLQTYLKVDNLQLLGKVPRDQELGKSVSQYQPVSSLVPNADSSLALQAVCRQLLSQIQNFEARHIP